MSTDLAQVDCQNLLFTGLLQVVPTHCNKSANDKLQQAWFYHTCCNLMKLTSLLKLVDKLQQAGKIDNLQQVSGVFGSVVLSVHTNISAVQTPGFSPPAPAKKTPAPGKKLRLRQKTCEN